MVASCSSIGGRQWTCWGVWGQTHTKSRHATTKALNADPQETDSESSEHWVGIATVSEYSHICAKDPPRP